MSAPGAPIAAVGFAGLGNMGRPMAKNLVRAGLLGAVWNRGEPTRRSVAAELGVAAATSPADLASRCDAIVTMVADRAAVESLYHAPDGLLAGLRPGTVCIEMSTIGPGALPPLAAAIGARGGVLVDAPVSGSVATAASAALLIMAGGADADVERARPVLDALGARVIHLGALGAGATMKLAVNGVVFAISGAIAEALVLAERAGIDRSTAYEVFAASAVAAPVVHYRRPQFEDPDGAPVSFSLNLSAKDLGLLADLAARVGAQMPQAAANAAVVAEAIAAGLGDADLAAVAVHLRRLAGAR